MTAELQGNEPKKAQKGNKRTQAGVIYARPVLKNVPAPSVPDVEEANAGGIPKGFFDNEPVDPHENFEREYKRLKAEVDEMPTPEGYADEPDTKNNLANRDEETKTGQRLFFQKLEALKMQKKKQPYRKRENRRGFRARTSSRRVNFGSWSSAEEEV